MLLLDRGWNSKLQKHHIHPTFDASKLTSRKKTMQNAESEWKVSNHSKSFVQLDPPSFSYVTLYTTLSLIKWLSERGFFISYFFLHPHLVSLKKRGWTWADRFLISTESNSTYYYYHHHRYYYALCNTTKQI